MTAPASTSSAGNGSTGALGAPTTIRVTLPGDSQALSVPLTATDRQMGWCGTGDPGSTITVTPVVTNAQAALR